MDIRPLSDMQGIEDAGLMVGSPFRIGYIVFPWGNYIEQTFGFQ